MIYTNPNTEVLSEDTRILTEGFTINKNPPKEFYRTALNITNGIIDIIGNLNIRRTIYNGKNFKNGTAKMKYNTSFTKSADRARDSIKSREMGKMPLANMNSRFSISLYIGSLGWDYSPSYVAQEVSKPIIKSGFYIMNESKNFLKSMFQNIYFYKPLSDKTLMVVKFGVSYVTQYGAFAGWTNISVHFKAVVNDEKSLRALNIVEAGNIERLSEGILGLTKEERDGLEKIKDTVKRLFRKRDKSNTKQATQKIKTIPLERKLFNEYKDKIFQELKNICKKYNDKDIHPEILEYDNFGIIYIIFHKDQEFNMSNRDLLYEIADELEKTEIYKDISEYASIDIGFGDGDEGCLYIDIFNILKESTIFKSVTLI